MSRFRFARTESSAPRRLHSLSADPTLGRTDSEAVLVRSAQPVDRLDEDDAITAAAKEEEDHIYVEPVVEDDDVGGGAGDPFGTMRRETTSPVPEAKNADVEDPFAGLPSLEADRDATTVVIEMDTSTSVI